MSDKALRRLMTVCGVIYCGIGSGLTFIGAYVIALLYLAMGVMWIYMGRRWRW